MSHQIQGEVYTGTHAVDVSSMAGKLFDLLPRELVGLQREKEGFDKVEAELADAAPKLPEIAAHYAAVVSHTSLLGQIRAAKAIAEKIVEVLTESEAKYEHERENAIGRIVDAVKSAAKRSGGMALLATFEKTLAYMAQAGMKAAATRKKNAAAKKAAGNG